MVQDPVDHDLPKEKEADLRRTIFDRKDVF